MRKYLIGMDIGGTSTKFGIFSPDGKLILKWSIPTNLEENGTYILSASWNSIAKKLKNLEIPLQAVLGIGIGIAGYTNSRQGIVHEAINIGWKDKSIINEFSTIADLPVFIENDANVAALGENWKGAGRGVEHILVVTLGTGVGSGIISNGEILNGISDMAGEIGHILVKEEGGAPCNCGNYGCLETIASATGVVRQAMEVIEDEPASSLAQFYQKNGAISAKDVFVLAETGDLFAEKIVNQIAKTLGLTFANVGVTVNPEVILIGGGVSQAGDMFKKRIQTYFERYALPRVKEHCQIKLAELGNDAGIIGAAYLVRSNMDKLSS